MKVAIYSGNIPSTTFIENLINGLSGAGIEIILFGKLKGKTNYESNVKIYATPESQISLLLFTIFQSFKLVFRDKGLFIKAFKRIKNKNKSFGGFIKNMGVILPMLIHRQNIFHIQWAKTVSMNPEIFDLVESKIVLSLRGAHINYSPLTDVKLSEAYKKYFPGINGFHAVSEAIKEETVKYGAHREKIKVVYSSVNEDLLLLNEDRKFRATAPEIISVGRFHWKKGYHYALDTMKILMDRNIDFSYTIIAQGLVPEEITFLISEYNLKDKVKIIPGMKFDELIKKLAQSDILILPSVEEGIANVVLEAMAAGVPVITTDCGGMNEAVEDNVNGYIVRVREPELIADKIITYMSSDQEFKKQIIEKAKQTVREKFSPERQIREFTDLYNSISAK